MTRKQRATAVSWKTKPMPAAHAVLDIEGAYTQPEYVTISYGFIPQSRDDKWFVYLDGEWLYFHRSWTGTCVFQLRIVPVDGHYEAVQAIVNRDPQEYRSSDDAYDVALLAYLIDRLLLGRFAPFPQPEGLSQEDQQRHQRLVMGSGDGSIDLNLLQNGRNG